MIRAIVHAVLLTAVAGGSAFASANEAGKVPTIGQIWLSNPATARPFDEAFRAGLRDLGYAEGKNVLIISRYAQGDGAQLPGLIDELISLRVDVLLVSPAAMTAAKEATQSVSLS